MSELGAWPSGGGGGVVSGLGAWPSGGGGGPWCPGLHWCHAPSSGLLHLAMSPSSGAWPSGGGGGVVSPSLVHLAKWRQVEEWCQGLVHGQVEAVEEWCQPPAWCMHQALTPVLHLAMSPSSDTIPPSGLGGGPSWCQGLVHGQVEAVEEWCQGLVHGQVEAVEEWCQGLVHGQVEAVEEWCQSLVHGQVEAVEEWCHLAMAWCIGPSGGGGGVVSELGACTKL